MELLAWMGDMCQDTDIKSRVCQPMLHMEPIPKRNVKAPQQKLAIFLCPHSRKKRLTTQLGLRRASLLTNCMEEAKEPRPGREGQILNPSSPSHRVSYLPPTSSLLVKAVSRQARQVGPAQGVLPLSPITRRGDSNQVFPPRKEHLRPWAP